MASRWDEEVCLGLQEEELNQFVDDNLAAIPLAPIPEDLPMPFATSPFVETVGTQLTRVSVDVQEPVVTAAVEEPVKDWWLEILDNRPLRRKHVVGSSTAAQGRDPATLTSPGSCQSEFDGPTTQRGQRLRQGVDRWHHPDGTA